MTAAKKKCPKIMKNYLKNLSWWPNRFKFSGNRHHDNRNINALVVDIWIFSIISVQDLKLVSNNYLEGCRLPKNKFEFIREIVCNLSMLNGQGLIKCHCQAGKRQWQTGRRCRVYGWNEILNVQANATKQVAINK